MGDVTVKLNLRGINEVMKSSPVQSEVVRRARRIANEAGDGFEAMVQPGRYTARAVVRTADETGRKRQATDAVLERSLDAGR